jgi:hypothetical protein
MTSKPVALLLADFGVTKSHSWPHVSNDNPYSESHFKTLKYRPEFPERFGSMEEARGFCQIFFPWYNTEHHHSRIGFLTPEQVHYGLAKQIVKERQEVLKRAYETYPDRFKRGMPKPMDPPEAVWINRSTQESDLALHELLDGSVSFGSTHSGQPKHYRARRRGVAGGNSSRPTGSFHFPRSQPNPGSE